MTKTLAMLLTATFLSASAASAGGAVETSLIPLANPEAPAATLVRNGCEIVDRGGYWNKVDPTCAFGNDFGGKGGDLPKPEKEKPSKH